MIPYRLIILLPFLLLSFIQATSQENPYVYRDSAIFFADSVKAGTLEETEPSTEENDEEDEFEQDTLLVNNGLAVEEDSVTHLKNSKQFAYAKNLDSLLAEYQRGQQLEDGPTKNKRSWLELLLLSNVTQYIFWLIAICFIAFILYKLFFTQGFFQRSYARAGVNVLKEDPGHQLTLDADYDMLVKQALTDKDYRLAVRYLYLQSLQKLSAKGVIQFSVDKTNYQYIRELTGKPYQPGFAAITRHYEYTWYGAFELDENLFNNIQYKFKQFNNEV